MFDRDLTHWYHDLFFASPAPRTPGVQPIEIAELCAAQQLDRPEARGAHWRAGRRQQARRDGTGTDLR